jgi:hypothetical protein
MHADEPITNSIMIGSSQLGLSSQIHVNIGGGGGRTSSG